MRTLHLLLALSCITQYDCVFETSRYLGQSHGREEKESEYTEITFYSTFQCNITGTYCLTGHYEEADKASNNEYILTLPFYCLEGSLSFKTITNYTGSDGWWSRDYDPALELFHNCSSSGRIYQIFREFKSVHDSKNSSEITFELDLTDSGVTSPTEFEEVPNDRSSKWPFFVMDWIFHNVPVHKFALPRDAPYFNQ